MHGIKLIKCVPLRAAKLFKGKRPDQTTLFLISDPQTADNVHVSQITHAVISNFSKAVGPKTDPTRQCVNSKTHFVEYESKPIIFYDFSEY